MVMALIVYKPYYTPGKGPGDFMQGVYQRSMTFLASDLLQEDVDPDDIKSAVKKAIAGVQRAGLNTREHFMSIISVRKGTSFMDCRLSKLGYALVLLNCNPKSQFIANFQLSMASHIM